jgi:hypothetical protein
MPGNTATKQKLTNSLTDGETIMRKETTMTKLLASVCVVALAAAPMMTVYKAQAATQGSLGATSTGSLDLSVKKDARVKISGLLDLTRAAWEDGNGDVILEDDLCVYSTKAGGGYKITANGSGAASAFEVASGTNILAYALKWNAGGQGALATPTVSLSPNTLSAAFANASTTSPNCASGDTARLQVSIGATAMAAAVDGTYTGVLTLIVSPS